ncbi:MAG: DUF6810 family protein [Chloroflexota bacterium]|nr:DUF6810 family protein [Chloroflexota bacterium]
MIKKFILINLILICFISCSSEEELIVSDEIITSMITDEDKIYKIEDFKNIGWKQNKKLNNSDFPKTIGIWYGFFNKRDVEIWIYNSHSDVLENGMSYAEEAINKRPTNRDPTNPTEIRYHAYVISGNSLILCEDKIEDCIELLSKIN